MHLPQFPFNYIKRSYLHERYEQHSTCKIVLIAAPSGYGKSLLGASFANTENCSVWLTLTKHDKQLKTFIEYIIYTIKKEVPSFGDDIIEICNQALALDDIDIVVQLFVKNLERLNKTICFVLDDYHTVNTKTVNDFINELFCYDIPNFKLIIISRNDPSLPLLEWKMKQLICEFRVNDLQFNEYETDAFLKASKAQYPQENYVQSLNQITEGWVSGLKILQLANVPISKVDMQNHHLDSKVLTQYVVHLLNAYSVSERKLILALSFSNEFNCDLFNELQSVIAKNEKISFTAIKQKLIKDSIFIIALDNDDNHYRYHHLFQKLLQNIAKVEFSNETIQALYSAVGHMQLSKFEYGEASVSYLKGNNIHMALKVFGIARSRYFNNSDWISLEVLMNVFEDTNQLDYAILFITKAWSNIYSGDILNLKENFDKIEASIKKDFQDKPDYSHYMGELFALKAYYYYNYDVDMHKSLDYSVKALNLLTENNCYAIGIAWVFYGGSMQALGKSKKAVENINIQINKIEQNCIKSNLYLILCYINWLDGNILQLKNIAIYLNKFAKYANNKEALANSYYFSGIANYYLGNKDDAKDDFNEFLELKHFTIIVHQFFGLAAMVLFSLKNDSKNHMDAFLNKLELIAFKSKSKTYIDLYLAISARTKWVFNQDPASLDWAMTTDLRPFIPMSDFTSAPIQQASILATSNTIEGYTKALELLNDLLLFLKGNNNIVFTINTNILKVLVLSHLNRVEDARLLFAELIQTARSFQIKLPFAILGDYLYAFSDIMFNDSDLRFYKELLSMYTEADGTNIELLSKRELEVFRLIEQGLLNKQIGATLYISEKTVKRHIANIYKKMNIKNRKQAVKMAHEIHN